MNHRNCPVNRSARFSSFLPFPFFFSSLSIAHPSLPRKLLGAAGSCVFFHVDPVHFLEMSWACTDTQSIFMIQGFRTCEFACLLKFIFNPQIGTHRTSTDTCRAPKECEFCVCVPSWDGAGQHPAFSSQSSYLKQVLFLVFSATLSHFSAHGWFCCLKAVQWSQV